MHRRMLLPLTAVLALAACAEPMLTREPPDGGIRGGQVVLVDDGTCPPGQVKQVTGGSNIGASGAGLPRTRACIRRPAGR